MFQILKIGYQNVSVETWMRASKFILKIPWCSEDIDQMQIEFPRSGIFPQSGMHTSSNYGCSSFLC